MTLPEHVLFVFLDGVGLGPEDPSTNPFAGLRLPSLERMADGQQWTSAAAAVTETGHVFRPIDATLGLPGLPQSGTGQATLFTGVNCAELAGRHYGPYPHSATRPVLAARNVFRQIEALELPYEEPAGFANAYPPRFFTYARERDRWTVTTRCCLDAGIPIRGEEALLEGRALSANLTGQGWPSDVPVPVISEEEAGIRLARLSRQHAFLLYEYFLTDKAGHSQSASDAEAVLISLDRFFGALLHALSDDMLLVVTSDHGNLEDLSTRTHTLNPVPLVAIGPGAAAFRGAADLTGITPVIVDLLRKAHATL
ncbi:MAG TPA: peptidase [Rhodothermales bacterium]|nr:peptidase [Rhodothermales bacterium]